MRRVSRNRNQEELQGHREAITALTRWRLPVRDIQRGVKASCIDRFLPLDFLPTKFFQ